MKKAILILGAVIINVLLTSTVYAGTLNSYEQEVISAARGAYEYEGVDYVVKQEYIDELIAYLSGDEIDLTAEQRDEVMQEAFASVERGVEEGYMIPISNEDTEGQDSSSDNQMEDGNSSSESEVIENGNSSTKQNEASDSGSDKPVKGDSYMSSPGDTIGKILGNQGTSAISEDIDKTDASDSNIIKDTGFNLDSTIATLTGMGVLMMAGMLVTIKYNFFAHKNE